MRTIILKVTHICNLGCRYCCVGDVEDCQIISTESLDNLFKKLAEDSGESTIVYHGGEPLCVGLEFYKKVVQLQSKYPNHKFNNSLQTNGTLLNDEWLRFFKDNDFHIGFSVDGCQISHDLNRPYKTGKSSFEDTLIRFMQARDLGMNVGALCVINKNTARYIEEIYQFAKDNQIPFKFNPQYPAGRAAINLDLGLDNDELAEAYIRLFDLWYADSQNERPEIRFFDYLISGISAVSNEIPKSLNYDCSFTNNCQYSFIGIAPNGDMFPCGKFVGDDKFKYGNINDSKSIKEALDNDIVKEFIKRHTGGIKSCERCKYKNICASGCPHTAYLFTGTIGGENPFCKYTQKLLSHIEKCLKRDSVDKDIYILPPSKVCDKYIVYSPLRSGAFFADKISVEQIYKYIGSGDLSFIKNEQLKSNLQSWSQRIPQPPTVYDINYTDTVKLLLTNKCNFQCKYCYSKKEHKNGASLGKIDLLAIIQHALSNHPSRMKTYSFIGGGEPTIEWGLLKECVEYIKNNSKSPYAISLTTNGSLLDSDRISWIRENDIKVILSFDILPDAQALRLFANGEKSFDIVDEALRTLIEHKVPVTLRSTITPSMVSKMPEMVDYAANNYPGITHLHFEPVMDDGIVYSEFLRDYLSSFDNAFIKGQEKGILVYNMLVLTLSTLRSRFCEGEFCISPDGNIMACQRIASSDSSFDKFSYGKVEDGKLDIDYNKMIGIRKWQENKSNACSECFAQYHCAGMCPALNESLSRQNREAYCSYAKELLQVMLYRQMINYTNNKN